MARLVVFIVHLLWGRQSCLQAAFQAALSGQAQVLAPARISERELRDHLQHTPAARATDRAEARLVQCPGGGVVSRVGDGRVADGSEVRGAVHAAELSVVED